MFQFTAHSDGRVIVPDEPVDIPEGQKLRVTIVPIADDKDEAQGRSRWFETALELSAQMPSDLPTDLAEQHDHYLYGSPKR